MPHPFHLSHNPQGNIGLQNALEAVKGETEGMVWIGALGNRTDGITQGVRGEIEERLWKEQNSKAVWLEDAVFEGHCEFGRRGSTLRGAAADPGVFGVCL